MIVKVSAMPTLTIAGSTYTAFVPVTTYDDSNFPDQSTALTVTGALTDTGAQFKTKLKTASDAWVANLTVIDTFEAKLATLVGKIL